MEVSSNARYQFTEELIEKAVLSLLKRKRYDDFTIKDLCIEAGINRSSFYSHYQDVNDLMIKIEGRLTKKIQEIWKPAAQGSFIETFVSLFEFIKEYRYFYKSFLKSHQPSFVMPEMMKKSHEQLRKISQNKNLNYSETEIDYHMYFFAGGLRALCGYWLQNDCTETPKEMAEILRKEYEISHHFQI